PVEETSRRARNAPLSERTAFLSAAPLPRAVCHRPVPMSRSKPPQVLTHIANALEAGRHFEAKYSRPSRVPRRLIPAPAGVAVLAPNLCQQTASGTNTVRQPRCHARQKRSTSSHPIKYAESHPPSFSNIQRRIIAFAAEAIYAGAHVVGESCTRSKHPRQADRAMTRVRPWTCTRPSQSH